MGIDDQFYFVALRVSDSIAAGGTLLVGVDFQGGLSSATSPRLNDCGWVTDRSGRRRLRGALEAIHQRGRGYQFALPDQELPTFPCVFTTDPNLRWLYSGKVIAEANDESFSFEELAEPGIPLSGENWLGVLRRCGRELRLDAYSTGDAPTGRMLKAYCPDWNEGFDEQDALILRVEMREVS